MEEIKEMENPVTEYKDVDVQDNTEVNPLTLNDYRTILRDISGLSPLDDDDDEETDNEINAYGEEEGNDPFSSDKRYIANGLLSYQLYVKPLIGETMKPLKGYTVDENFTPNELFIQATVDGTTPRFTKFTFCFNIESEEGLNERNELERALRAFNDFRQNSNYNINEELPVCVFNIQGVSDESIKVDFLNPLLMNYSRDSIEVIVDTELVSVTY